ncbi:hypothetical protein BAUCODRAFT_120082 [Baudoinia panamericana UAMH 10762]|uniref:ATP-dependent RNA helicase n=1 Tax=Baudoinia panamericana (strain UAMH 10762) TaxID=717646 RepID=M2LVU0_BAUPA|nr:uncharacterized protein BAUCODRAFT_120082 [Baudoinia panamericana UAMH 10762]EMC98782.1 hypothetical protein BAUCODRAFT_120082 [Baudoinia panamericana UAMH 10762]
MDPLKLLSRATKPSKSRLPAGLSNSPSQGAQASKDVNPRKRKRGEGVTDGSNDNVFGLEFFHHNAAGASQPFRNASRQSKVSQDGSEGLAAKPETALSAELPNSTTLDGEAKAVLNRHKVKITWLNPGVLSQKDSRNCSAKRKPAKPALYPHPLHSIGDLQPRFDISRKLASNLDEQGYVAPTEVQLATLPLLLDRTDSFLPRSLDATESGPYGLDMLTVAPTGSGKTLAFLVPLVHKARHQRRTKVVGDNGQAKAIILAPTKELVSQIVNEGRKLTQGTGVRVVQLRKGMRLIARNDSDRGTVAAAADAPSSGVRTIVRADILVSTPGLLHAMLRDDEISSADLVNVSSLILDEADVLLDPLFREQTLSTWDNLNNPELRVSLWSATMGSNIEELTRSTLERRLKRLREQHGLQVEEAPLIRVVVGLKDSAVSNVQHRLVYAATEQGKLMALRQLLHPTSTSKDIGPSLLPPFLVFTQTIERAIALHSELLYDIPAEAGGISRIAVLHADLSDTARDSVMTRFRKGEIWVLITTDLLSRGVDFRGVNGVVNYDIPTSSAAYVHRVGRTGRAGRVGGVAVTLYSREDMPYMKHVANVVAIAQKQQVRADGGVDNQQWLLDTLPKLSKQEKEKFKKGGIESRTARGKDADPKSARRARISSKSGYVRRAENNRRSAIIGNRQRAPLTVDGGDEIDFVGFD